MSEKAQDACRTAGTDVIAVSMVEKVAARAISQLASPVTGRTVLDLACGEGKMARWLAAHGANVTGIDPSQACIDIAREKELREPHGISYVAGDPEDLYMADDSAFDDVICNLSIASIDSLALVVAEIARIIRLGGRFIFTVAHPCFDLRFMADPDACPASRDYFVEGERDGLGGTVHHRTLATYINAVAARGFTVRRILEPAAEEMDVEDTPEYSAWCRSPIVLAVEAVFPRI